MPHEIMNTMHETGMAGSHHWLFWVAIGAIFFVTVIFIWWFFIRKK